jgi:muramoyltetrapeptide carboxypeptidase
MCPAGFMPKKKVQECVQTLQAWGYKVVIGKTVGGSSRNYFSAPDDIRLKELQQMLSDKKIRAILFARGGYGTSRIIDRVDFSPLKKDPKWLIGFSDITVIHNHLLNQAHLSSIHGPMASAFIKGTVSKKSIDSLRDVLSGEKIAYAFKEHRYNKPGKVTAELAGGNLALLANTIGTASACPFSGKILFIEDVGEYYYSIDRMMIQLQRAGWLEKIKGILIGGFTDMKDTKRPFGKKPEEIIRDIIAPYRIPAAFGVPVSHGKENVALKTGIPYMLTVSRSGAVLKEV